MVNSYPLSVCPPESGLKVVAPVIQKVIGRLFKIGPACAMTIKIKKTKCSSMIFLVSLLAINDLIFVRLQNTINHIILQSAMNFKLLFTAALAFTLIFVSNSQKQPLSLYRSLQQGKQLEIQLPHLFQSIQLVLVTPLISEQQVSYHICTPRRQTVASFHQAYSISRHGKTQTKEDYHIEFNMEALFQLGNHLDSLFVQQWSKLFLLLKDQSLQIYTVSNQNQQIKLQKTNKLSEQAKNPIIVSRKTNNQTSVFIVSQNNVIQLGRNGQFVSVEGFQTLEEQIVDASFHKQNMYIATSSMIHHYQIEHNKLKKLLSHKIQLAQGLLVSIQEIVVDSKSQLMYVSDNQFGVLSLNLLDLVNAKNSIQGYVVYSQTGCHSLTVYKKNNNLIFLCPNLVVIQFVKITQCLNKQWKNCGRNFTAIETLRLGYYGKSIMTNQSQIIVVGHTKYEYLYPVFDNKTEKMISIIRGPQIDFKRNAQNLFINQFSIIILTQTAITSGKTVPQKIFINCKTQELRYKTSGSFTGQLSGNITISGLCQDIVKNESISTFKISQSNLCSKNIALRLQISTPLQKLNFMKWILISLLAAVTTLILIFFAVKQIKLIRKTKEYENLIQQNEHKPTKSKRVNQNLVDQNEYKPSKSKRARQKETIFTELQQKNTQ